LNNQNLAASINRASLSADSGTRLTAPHQITTRRNLVKIRLVVGFQDGGQLTISRLPEGRFQGVSSLDAATRGGKREVQ
jgi:hypothetical protein